MEGKRVAHRKLPCELKEAVKIPGAVQEAAGAGGGGVHV